MTVIEYVLSRLRQIGVTDIFGVPGDFSFPINDAICLSKEMRWIGCSNELNAAYAADGYARVRGVGAVCTTYGVGELSAINGIAGSYAERLPVFHLVGMPNQSTQEARALVHHTLGNGAYEFFYQMTEPVVCARAIITPQNVVFQTERLIAEALYRRRPVYLAFPADLAQQPVLGAAQNPFEMPGSDLVSLNAAVGTIVGALEEAKTACVLPGFLLARAGLQTEIRAFIDASNLPFATMFMDKSIIDEQHPNHIGMYEGALLNEHVRANEGRLREVLDSLRDLPIVGDVRGAGYFHAIELVKDKDTKETFNAEESEQLLRGFLSGELYRRGLICRTDDRGDPIVQFSPPLIAGEEQFAEIEAILRPVLTEAGERMGRWSSQSRA